MFDILFGIPVWSPWGLVPDIWQQGAFSRSSPDATAPQHSFPISTIRQRGHALHVSGLFEVTVLRRQLVFLQVHPLLPLLCPTAAVRTVMRPRFPPPIRSSLPFLLFVLNRLWPYRSPHHPASGINLPRASSRCRRSWPSRRLQPLRTSNSPLPLRHAPPWHNTGLSSTRGVSWRLRPPAIRPVCQMCVPFMPRCPSPR